MTAHKESPQDLDLPSKNKQNKTYIETHTDTYTITYPQSGGSTEQK